MKKKLNLSFQETAWHATFYANILGYKEDHVKNGKDANQNK